MRLNSYITSLSPIQRKELAKSYVESLNLDILFAIYKYILSPYYLRNKDMLGIGLYGGATAPSRVWLMDVFVTIFTSEEWTKGMTAAMPYQQRDLIRELIWEGRNSIKHFQDKLKIELVENVKSYTWSQYSYTTVKKGFEILTHHKSGYGSNTTENDELSLDSALKKLFRCAFSLPERFGLKLHENLPSEENLQVYESDIANGFPDNLPDVLNFIVEHLEYGATDKPLKASLKTMQEYCAISEFYSDTKGELALFATTTLINGLTFCSGKEKEGIQILKTVIESFIKQDFRTFGESFLKHVLGWSKDIDLMKISDVPDSMIDITKALPSSQWVQIESVVRNAVALGIPLRPWQLDHARNYLRVDNVAPEIYLRNVYSKNIYPPFYDDAITIPMMKTFFAVLGVLGIVDVAYSRPKNERVSKANTNYLSLYDGMQYVRLTSLGAYVLGLTSVYKPRVVAKKREEATFLLDTEYLHITLSIPDVLRASIAEKFGRAVGRLRFKVDFQSFFKGCHAKDEMEFQIAYFKRVILGDDDVPENWQRFFDNALRKVSPLVNQPKWQVFQLKNDPDLLRLFQSHSEIKKFTVRAEDRRFLIKPKDVPKLKLILELNGYIVPELS